MERHLKRLLKTAKLLKPEIQKKKKIKWFDKEGKRVIEDREKAKIQALSVQTEESYEEYRRCRRKYVEKYSKKTV